MGRIKKITVIAAFVGVVTASVVGCAQVVAKMSSEHGGGDETEGTSTSCSGASNGYTGLCDGGKWGGYDERLYLSTSDKTPYYNKNVLGNENHAPEFAESLARNGFGIARGWAAKNGMQCGPIRTEGGIINQIQYNNHNGTAATLEQALVAIVNGNIPAEGLPLQDGVMEQLAMALASLGITYQDGWVTFSEQALRVLLGLEEDGGSDPGPGPGDCKENCTCRNWTPGSYGASSDFYGETSVLVKIMNGRLGGMYSGWQGSINGTGITYARPGDNVGWIGCYFPGVQSTWQTEITHIEGAHDVSRDTWNDNKPISKIEGWSNDYAVRSWATTSSNPFNIPGGGSFAWGDTTIREWSTSQNMYKTSASDAGKSYGLQMGTENPVRILIKPDVHKWDCDGKCCKSHCVDEEGNVLKECCDFYTHSNDFRSRDRDDGPRESQAKVDVPYNFVNTSSVEIKQKDHIYSGNTVTVKKATVTVGTRSNEVTEDTYATQVDGAEVKLIAYVKAYSDSGFMIQGGKGGCGNVGGKQCWEEVWDQHTLNSEGNLKGTTDHIGSFEGDWNAFDASAGDYMCFRVSVYPALSGVVGSTSGDMDMDPEGTHQTYYSEPACVVIAKRPSFEIYGGSLYSAGSITATYMQKYNVRDLVGGTDLYNLEKKDNKNRTVFGSWVEQSVVTNGANKWLASGAARGLRVDKNGKAIGGNFSLGKTEYCLNQAPLSMSNYGDGTAYATNICPNVQVTGYANVGNDISNGIQNRKELVDFWGTGEVNTDADEITLVRDDINETYSKINSATGKRIYYIYGKGKMTITEASSISKSATYIVRTDEDIVIADDIKYNAGTTTMYTAAGQIPKVVIYAKNNIKISCSVERIDAILIAGKTVDTCMESAAGEKAEDVNSKLRSNRLHIRGMVIANKINLGRTYGSAAGYYSNTPAESINYDTSAILWGRYMSGSAESDTLTTVYQHETAPRY